MRRNFTRRPEISADRIHTFKNFGAVFIDENILCSRSERASIAKMIGVCNSGPVAAASRISHTACQQGLITLVCEIQCAAAAAGEGEIVCVCAWGAYRRAAAVPK